MKTPRFGCKVYRVAPRYHLAQRILTQRELDAGEPERQRSGHAVERARAAKMSTDAMKRATLIALTPVKEADDET